MLWNNLGKIYELQGRRQECIDLMHRLRAEFPDYLFGITTEANTAILDGEYEHAATLLSGLIQRKRLHISEFVAVAEAYVRLHIAMEQIEQAQTWMEMWDEIAPDHPAQRRLRKEIAKLQKPSPSWRKWLG